MQIDEIRTIAIKALSELNIQKVILFGSFSTGRQTTDSDIDLLVVTNDDYIPESFMQKMTLKTKIAKALSELRDFADIDLIVHTKPMYERFLQLDSSFKRDLLKTGTILYEANNA
jgi:uncharacterized protein